MRTNKQPFILVGMQFALTGDHKYRFEERGFIEFDELLTAAECERLCHAVDEALAKSLKNSRWKRNSYSSEELWLGGRDLSNRNAEIQRVTSRRRLLTVLAELTGQHQLRWAYDQVITSGEGTASMQTESLNQTSCFQGLVGAILLRIEGEDDEPNAEIVKPSTLGAGVFITATKPIDYQALVEPGQRYLLMVYGQPKLAYIHNPQDLHTHQLKDLGYVFGDRVKDTTHPIVLR